jgi:hypothetical protein
MLASVPSTCHRLPPSAGRQQAEGARPVEQRGVRDPQHPYRLAQAAAVPGEGAGDHLALDVV